MRHLDRELLYSRRNFVPPCIRNTMFSIGKTIGHFIATTGQKLGERLYILSLYADKEQHNWRKHWGFDFESED